MKRKNTGAILLAAALFFLLFSCASSPQAFIPMDTAVRSSNFDEALTIINGKRGNRSWQFFYTPRNDILFYLDRGMILHFAGQFAESSRDLEMAERLIEEAFTRSLTQEIGTFLLNDNVRDYAGQDYENLYINVFNALNYYHRGDLEGALVEIRRLNEKLNVLADRYERAKNRVLESNQQIDINRLPVEASRFSNSALARYLGVLFYRGTGRADSARIDYEELRRAFALAPEVYYHPIPSSVADELYVPAGMGRLNVIAFTGLSPFIVEQNIFIPLFLPPPYHFARIAIPRMVVRPQIVRQAEAVLCTGERFPLELLEDMGAVAVETFRSRQGLTVLKTTARTIAKNTASLAAANAVSRNSNEGLGFLTGLFGKIFTEVSERADTRLSRYFPSHALVGGFNLKPGNYVLTVNFYGAGGLVFSERREVIVRENTLNLEQFVYLR